MVSKGTVYCFHLTVTKHIPDSVFKYWEDRSVVGLVMLDGRNRKENKRYFCQTGIKFLRDNIFLILYDVCH